MNTKNFSVVASWQKSLELIKNLVGNGYHYIHVQYLPMTKKEKWNMITDKLIKKYKADITKDKRHHRKKKSLANFYIFRWENVLVMLHTDGNIIVPNELKADLEKKKKLSASVISASESGLKPMQLNLYQCNYDDAFTDVRRNPVFFKISDEVSFSIALVEKVDKDKKVSNKMQATIKLHPQFVKDKKAEFAELLGKKAKSRVIQSFQMLNGFPDHRGIVLQKQEIREFVLLEAKTHGVKLNAFDLFITSKLDATGRIFADHQVVEEKK